MNSNIKRSKQLGMDFSTATNRLKKKILFSLIQRLEEDICFQCGNLIETEDELSIEHKIPWLHKSPDLFWNLENIAFSHLRCNSGAFARKSTKCLRGHEFTADNTYIHPSRKSRVCRMCARDRERKRWHTSNRAEARRERRKKQLVI